jgi:hypothetical protein
MCLFKRQKTSEVLGMSNQLAELQMKLDDAINNRVKAENDWNHMFEFFFFIFDFLKKKIYSELNFLNLK